MNTIVLKVSKGLLFFVLILSSLTSFAQLSTTNNAPFNTANNLVQNVLMGNGITATNIVFTGAPSQLGYFDGSTSNLGLNTGVIMSTGDIASAQGANTNGGTSDDLGGTGDPDLDLLAPGFLSQDKAVLEFDFIPIGDSVIFRYVFASEEYNEYVCSNFNDVFGFFISGPGFAGPYSGGAENIALIPGSTNIPVAINTINNGTAGNPGDEPTCAAADPNWTNNTIYYVDNTNGPTVEFDGFTVVLEAKAYVECGESYHIKMAVGDMGDGSFNSAVFLEAESFSSPGITIDISTVSGDTTIVEGCASASFTFVRPEDVGDQTIFFDIEGNAENGVDYDFIADSVVIPAGSLTNTVTISPVADGVVENGDTVIVTVYNVTQCGDTIPEVATIIIEDENSLNVTGLNDNSDCPGDPVTISASTAGGTPNYQYTWSNGLSGTPVIYNPIENDTLIVESFDDDGCTGFDTIIVEVSPAPVIDAGQDQAVCPGSSVQLNATGGVTYSWLPAGSLNDASIGNPVATPGFTTTYVVTGTNAVGCSSTDDIVLTVSNTGNANIDAGPDLQVCIGDSVQLNATGGVTYSWEPIATLSNPNIGDPMAGPTVNTEYIVEGIDASNCTGEDTVLVVVNTLPLVDAGEDDFVCSSPGSVATLDGTGTGNASWSPSATLSADNVFNPIASPNVDTEYVLEITDNNGCVNTDTVLISVFGTVPTEAGNDTTICQLDTIQIGGNPSAFGANTIYSWTPAGLVDDPTASNPLAFPTVTTMFYLNTSNDTCNGIDSVLITVNPLPNVNAGLDEAICLGDTIQLNASGAIDYTWNEQVTLSDSLVPNPLVFPLNTIEYVVFGTDVNSCTTSDTVDVVVNSLPNIFAGNDTSICINDTAQLIASGGNTYQWLVTSNLSDPGIFNPEAFPIITTEYVVEGTDLNNCISTDTVLVTVNSLPIIDAGQDTSICINDAANLLASGGVDYLWSPSATLDNANIANPSASNLLDQIYFVTGTDINGCSNIDSVTVFVNALPIIDAGLEDTICSGDTLQLSASGAVDYLWTPVGSLSNETIQDPLAFPINTTEYVVLGTDVNTCSNTDTVEIFVHQLPIVFAGADTAICINDSAQLFASGATVYEWLTITDITNVNINNPIVFPSADTEYIVLGTDDNGCINIDSILVLVNVLPNIDAGLDTTICINDVANLQASGGNNYIWTPGATLSDPSISNPQASNVTDQMYFVVGTDANACSNIDSVAVFVNSLPTIEAGDDIQICIGDTAQLNATGGVSYSWSPNINLSNTNVANPIASPNDTTMYFVNGADAIGCTNIDSITVIVNPLPSINAGIDESICLGDTILLTATGADIYTWSPGAFILDPNLVSVEAYPDTTMIFIATGIDSNSCVNSDSVLVNVFRVGAIPDTAICLGDSVQLGVVGSPGLVYSWTPSIGLSDPNISNPWASPSQSTTYTISATNIAGCFDQDSMLVEMWSEPTAHFDTTVLAGCEGVVVEFTNNSIDGVSYLWEYGDGNSDTTENTEYIYPYTSTFTTTLTVTNIYGCMDTVSLTGTSLGYDDYVSVTVPNVFTPNGDGVNDQFFINVPGRIYECVEMTIFNRWGQIMFTNTSYNIKWDGRTPVGLEVPNGNYFYTIVVNGEQYSGTLQLFR